MKFCDLLVRAHLFMNVDAGREVDVAKAVSVLPYSPSASVYYGVYDVGVWINAPSSDIIADTVLQEIRPIAGVRNTLTSSEVKSFQPKKPPQLKAKNPYRGRVLISARIGKEDEIAKSLRSIPNVKGISTVYGIYDVIVDVETFEPEELEIVIRKIRHRDQIRRTSTMIEVQSFNQGTPEYPQRERPTKEARTAN